MKPESGTRLAPISVGKNRLVKNRPRLRDDEPMRRGLGTAAQEVPRPHTRKRRLMLAYSFIRRTAALGLVAGSTALAACGISTQQEVAMGQQYATGRIGQSIY
jgi:hypothetical protein